MSVALASGWPSSSVDTPAIKESLPAKRPVQQADTASVTVGQTQGESQSASLLDSIWLPRPILHWANQTVLGPVLHQIAEIAEYAVTEEPAWHPIAPETVLNAQMLILRLYNIVHLTGVLWVAPFVSSDGEGIISFEWWQGDRTLTLYAYDNGMVETLFSFGPGRARSIESNSTATDAALRGLWMRLTGNE